MTPSRIPFFRIGCKTACSGPSIRQNLAVTEHGEVQIVNALGSVGVNTGQLVIVGAVGWYSPTWIRNLPSELGFFFFFFLRSTFHPVCKYEGYQCGPTLSHTSVLHPTACQTRHTVVSLTRACLSLYNQHNTNNCPVGPHENHRQEP